MGFLKKLLRRKSKQPAQRVRICSQCGMPVEQHKEWCSIAKAKKSYGGRPAEASGND